MNRVLECVLSTVNPMSAGGRQSWADGEALTHRVAISRAQPSLPQRAGRAWKQLSTQPQQQAMSRRERRIYVRGIRRADPDMTKLARALIQYHRDQLSAGPAMGVTHLDPTLEQPLVDGVGGDAESLGDAGQ